MPKLQNNKILKKIANCWCDAMPKLHNNKCNAVPKLQNNRKEEIIDCKCDVMEKKTLLQVNNGHKDFVQTIANVWCLLDDYYKIMNKILLKFSVLIHSNLDWSLKLFHHVDTKQELSIAPHQ